MGGSEREIPTPCENHRRNPNDGEPESRDNHEHGNKHASMRNDTGTRLSTFMLFGDVLNSLTHFWSSLIAFVSLGAQDAPLVTQVLATDAFDVRQSLNKVPLVRQSVVSWVGAAGHWEGLLFHPHKDPCVRGGTSSAS